MVPEQSGSLLQYGQLLAGKYSILELLGEGGMGMVYAAHHLDLDRKVAIKLVRSELAKHPGIIPRLLAEARAAAQIRSEHVCQVIDVGRLDSGFPYLVMEYLEGTDLFQLLVDQKSLPEPLAVDLLLEACEGVAEAHAVGIIHRDLKPENLFLANLPDGSAVLKVLDFGIAKATRNVSETEPTIPGSSSGMGSPYYMAPEQMTNADDVDTRADIWSLGAILYQMVAGQPPFDGDGLPALCAAVLQSEPTPLRELNPKVSTDLEQAILCCLRKDRAQRFATVAQLAEAIAPLGSRKTERSLERILHLSQTFEVVNAVQSPRTTTPPRYSGIDLVSFREQKAPPARDGTTTLASPGDGLQSAQPERRFQFRRTALVWALIPVFLLIGGALLFSRGRSSVASAVSPQATTPGKTAGPTQATSIASSVSPVAPEPIQLLLAKATTPSQQDRTPTHHRQPTAVRAAPSSNAVKTPRTTEPVNKKTEVNAYDPSTFGGRW